MAYNIIFYEKKNGESEMWDFLEHLRQKSLTNKDARIQYRQIILYIELLQKKWNSSPRQYYQTHNSGHLGTTPRK